MATVTTLRVAFALAKDLYQARKARKAAEKSAMLIARAKEYRELADDLNRQLRARTLGWIGDK